jgi:predicted DNA-binding transcriptional regulator AlpA
VEGLQGGQYPKPIKLGPRTTVWKKSEIQELVAKIAGISDHNSVEK